MIGYQKLFPTIIISNCYDNDVGKCASLSIFPFAPWNGFKLLYITKICILNKIFINHFFEEDCNTVRTSNLNSDCAGGGWSFASIHSLHDNTVGGLDLVVQTGVQS